MAIRADSKAKSKQLAGVEEAITTTWHSPWRPYKACIKSDCSVFVGNPVEGPPRCTSTTTNGSSALTAKPRPSLLSDKPGPEVDDTPRHPANEAPMAEQIPAISSSAWKAMAPRLFILVSSWRISDAGVIG